MPWNVLECCDEIYITESQDYIEDNRFNNFERYLIERGMGNTVDAFKKINVCVEPEALDNNLWSRMPFYDFYEELLSDIVSEDT